MQFGGHRWAILGAGHRQGDPAVLAYRVDDLSRWQPAGILLDTTDPVAASVATANIWECPNLFPVDGRWVLIVSLLGRTEEGTNRVRYLIGDLEPTDDPGLRFRPESGGLLDDGPAFYAPQVIAVDGRAVLWGWSWELRDQVESDAAGWAGSLTLPRELHIREDRLVSAPVPELAALVGDDLHTGRSITEHAFLVRFTGPGTLAADDQTVLSVTGPTEVWVDGSVVEAYPESGVAHTTRAYPSTGWTVTGPATVSRLARPTRRDGC